MTTAPKHATTGIGSLPHHNADAALEYSFRMGIPFLPQIPIRNPWEYMLAQALEGLPGLQAESDGSVTLNTDVWLSRASDFNRRLEEAFDPKHPERIESFEPSPSTSSCWQPFVWELEERGIRVAKVQIAGPMTAQWSLRLSGSDATPAFFDRNPELTTQIFRLVLARAIAMCRRLKSAGAKPILYLDEPGLYAFSIQNPRHVLALQELKLLAQALGKEGVELGIHCCSNTDWTAVLALPIRILSLDTALSLESLLARTARRPGGELERFIEGGGRLSLGVIPTGRSSLLHSLDAAKLYESVAGQLKAGLAHTPSLARRILREAIFTPACGLALQSTADAELILDSLARLEAVNSENADGRRD